MDLAEKLQNGGADCLKTQGKAIALLVKMITPLYEAEFITVDQFVKREAELRNELFKKRTPQQIKQDSAVMKLKVGPVEIAGGNTASACLSIFLLSPLVIFVYMVGRVQNWW